MDAGARAITGEASPPSGSIVQIPGDEQSSSDRPEGKCEKAIPDSPQTGKALRPSFVRRFFELPSGLAT